ncbi:MAG: ferredoxin, partial [Cyclobacteriaceae bacterium]|nr:ferredoxin [Cyclobacteriaceae bacterium]
ANLLKGKLQDLLTVEKEKDTGDQLTSNLKSSIGFADSLINLDEMSSVNPESGSELMSLNRIKRIKSIIKTISEGESFFKKNATLLFHKELYSDKNLKLKSIFNNSIVVEFSDKNGCEESVKEFNKNIVSYEKFISALRVAQLEAGGNYIDEIHDEYFSSFEWRMFTEEEMACFPPIILISELNTLISDELSNFSKLLSQNIPVKIVSLKRDSLEGYGKNGKSVETSHFAFRQELAAIAVAHRNTYVLQSATISPQYLFQGFAEGLNHFSPAIFNIYCPSDVNYKSPYLWGSAAVEARDFPQFIYNGNLTSQWGSRFDVSNNPQSDANWPLHDVKIITSKGEEETWNLPFTFADYSFINNTYSHHFQLVDTKYWNDKLIPLSDYLSLDESETPSKVPFIWVVDANNGLQKVAVSFSIVLACKERLDFWDYLQENAGIHNYHVDEAIERERNHFKSVTEEEISKVKEELNKEIEKVRKETTDEAMEKLTNFLLDMDDLSLVSSTPSSQKVDVEIVKEEVTTSESINEEEIKETEEEIVTEEPWIETPSCTTCNECTDINDRMFSYNADKMAYIADPKAGTYKELVDAAALCPVGIIHPGKPLNLDEPGLEELIKIAEEYN